MVTIVSAKPGSPYPSPCFVASCESGCHTARLHSLEAALAAAEALQTDCGDEPWLNLPHSQTTP